MISGLISDSHGFPRTRSKPEIFGMTSNDSLHVNSPIETAILGILIVLVVCFRPSASKIENSSPSSIVVTTAFLIQSAETKLCVAPESINVQASQFPHLKWQSPHGAAFWRLDDDACGPDWTKTFLAGWHNIVEKRCHYHWLFSEPGARPWRNFTPPLCAREASWCSIAISAIFFAVRAPFQVTSRPGITMIFFCDALSQVVSSDFSAAIMNTIRGSQDWKGSVDFVSLRSPRCRPVDQRSPLCASDPFLSPSISVSASVALSGSMLRGICDGGICGGTSTVSVSLPCSSLASRHRCSTHRKTSVRLRRALPTGSHSCAQPSTFRAVWRCFAINFPEVESVILRWASTALVWEWTSAIRRRLLQTCNAWSSTTKEEWLDQRATCKFPQDDYEPQQWLLLQLC